MPTVVKKRNRDESNDKLIRRFTRSTQGFLRKLKEERYHTKPDTKGRVRERAIKREEYRKIRRKEAFM